MKVQGRITLPPDVRREIDRLRVAWNPECAAGNPAHITVAYQDEAPDPALLIERVRLAPSRPPPVRDAFLAVVDPARGVAAVRDAALAPPFARRGRFGLHVILLHPVHRAGRRALETGPSSQRAGR